jgi:ligand-binding SRPBCC domain-containing protein
VHIIISFVGEQIVDKKIMTTIKIYTSINAPIEKCFDVSRDINIHELSAKDTREKAVAGKTSGLCELNDEITWEATHFGIRQTLTVRISKMDRPFFFEDTMLKGAFQSMRHEHNFSEVEGGTKMIDIFMYEVPFGFIGKMFDQRVLKAYMTRFLESRNQVIKMVCECIE